MKRLLLSLFLLTLSLPAFAQDGNEHMSPFALGAGKTFAVSARGLDASGLNPALLAIGSEHHVELSVLPITGIGLIGGPTLIHLNDIARGFQDSNLASQQLTADSLNYRGDSTREAITDLLRSGKLSSTIDMRVFGISYNDPSLGSFALTWATHASLRANIDDSLLSFLGPAAIHLLTQGILTSQSADIQALWYNDYTLSYARTILGEPLSGRTQLMAGIGLKYLSGTAYFRIDPNSSFSVNWPIPQPGGSAVLFTKYEMRMAYPTTFSFDKLPSGFGVDLLTGAGAGSGLGGDIGFTLGDFDSTRHASWQLGLSVTDIGSIHWTQSTYVRSANVYNDTVNLQNITGDKINSQLKALSGNLDTNAGPFTTLLPTTLHAAAALDLDAIGLSVPGFTLSGATEVAYGLTSTVGSPQHGRFGIATMLDRPGSAFGFHTALGFTTQDGSSGLTFALGVSFGNFFFFDLGSANVTNLFSNDHPTDLAASMRIQF